MSVIYVKGGALSAVANSAIVVISIATLVAIPIHLFNNGYEMSLFLSTALPTVIISMVAAFIFQFLIVQNISNGTK